MILWHNPRCSKSRETLALLLAQSHDPEIRRYLEDAPTADELLAVQTALGVAFTDMLRTKDKAFKDMALDGKADVELRQIVAENPALIERPILINGPRAAIGRPPENVLTIL